MDLIASRRYQPDAEEPAEIDYHNDACIRVASIGRSRSFS